MSDLTYSENTIIQFDHVIKRYGEQIALNDFSLSVERGAFLTIIGSSGCGKTTALKMINGLNIPDSGQILVEGTDISNTDLIALRRRIGYVIQGTALFPHMTIRSNIVYVLKLTEPRNSKKHQTAAERLIQTVGLDSSMLDRYPSELSGGQQQRVGIARALAVSPPILLMDEPFGAVDEITRKNLQDEILRIHRELKTTIVFVTHDIREALKLGTHILVMDNGQKVQYAPPEELLSSPANHFVTDLLSSAGL